MDSSISELPTKVIGMSNLAYRSETRFDSRTTIHTVAKHGGEAQEWIDSGNTFWGGNAATSTGSEFDQLITWVLEGRSLESQIAVPPEAVLGKGGSRSTNAYKDWAAQQTGVICTEEKRWQYVKMYDRMRENAACCELMDETTETQASVFFEHQGHLLKVRPDAGSNRRWWDLKTTSHYWNDLFRSVMSYGYAEQEWLYVLGAMAVGLPHFRMPFVFVQTIPPYRTRVFYIPEQLVENAGKRMLNTLEMMQLRRSTGQYLPEDAGEIQEMYLPNWAMKEEEVVEV